MPALSITQNTIFRKADLSAITAREHREHSCAEPRHRKYVLRYASPTSTSPPLQMRTKSCTAAIVSLSMTFALQLQGAQMFKFGSERKRQPCPLAEKDNIDQIHQHPFLEKLYDAIRNECRRISIAVVRQKLTTQLPWWGDGAHESGVS